MSNIKTMHVFYLVKDIDFLFQHDKYDIYAYTTDKKLAKMFIDSRNMDNFYYKRIKMNRHDVNTLYRQHTKSQLEIINGITCDDEYKIKNFSLAGTIFEKNTCINNSVYVYDNLLTHVWSDPMVFKYKYIKSLDTLLYTMLHSFIVNGDNYLYRKARKKIHADELSILLSTYGNLF